MGRPAELIVAASMGAVSGLNQIARAFTRITGELESSLADSQFPHLARYYLIDMEGNHTAIVVNHGNFLQGMLVDNKRANLGLVISVAIPRMVDAVQKAKGTR